MEAVAKPTREVSVSVRLSPTEKRDIAAAAKLDGMAPATWMRQQALRASRLSRETSGAAS